MIDQAFFALLVSAYAEPIGDGLPTKMYWTVRRKAALVTAIKMGKITAVWARCRFRLSDEELDSWITAIERNGIPGLRATRFQIYRDAPSRSRCSISSAHRLAAHSERG